MKDLLVNDLTTAHTGRRPGRRRGSRRRSTTFACCAGALAAALVLAGCGSRSDGAAATSAGQGTVSSHQPTGAFSSLVPNEFMGKTLDIAFEVGNLPLSDYTADRSSLQGLDYDLTEAMAKVLGVKFTYHGTNFDALIPGIQGGRYTLAMSGIFDTLEREKVVDEVTYMNESNILITKKGGKTGLTPTSLCGLKVAVEAGSSEAAALPDSSKTCQADGKQAISVQIYPNQGAQYLAVASGRADVINTPTSNGDYLIKTRPDDFQQAGPTYGQVPVAIVLRKSSPLTSAVQSAVNELIKNGTYAKIFAKWGLNNAAIARSKVNDASGK